MSQHYIVKINVNQVRHLHDIVISLGSPMKNLILTGKNGSGKTSLLEALRNNMQSINDGDRSMVLSDYRKKIRDNKRIGGIEIDFSSDEEQIDSLFNKGLFITAFYPANRMAEIKKPHGVEDIKLQRTYYVDEDPVSDFLKYMVHLKTQQSFAKNENDIPRWKRIQQWFDDFETALRRLMDDDSIDLKYDYRNYNFTIHQAGRNPYDFSQLSDGFSAALRIMADLMLRMDQNWLMYDAEISHASEGVVLIDEVETHLHLELQRTILPFLTEMFPNLQFIVSTHSPFIVNSLENAVVYDLERHIAALNGLSNVTYEGVVEGYFRADILSEKMREKFDRYKELVKKEELTDDDYEEIMGLEMYLEEIPDYLSIGIAAEYRKLKLEFRIREEAK